MNVALTSVYGLIDPIEHKIRYVGKTTSPDKRLRDHIRQARHRSGRNTLKAEWIRRLASAGARPDMIVLEECGDEWPQREKYWIARIPHLLNEKSGGQIGCKPEAARKISAALKANKTRHGPEWRAKHADAMRGRKQSPETIAKRTARQIGNQRAKKHDYVAVDAYGVEHVVDNFTEFCRSHKLDRARMAALAAGDPLRKQHKGWRCRFAVRAHNVLTSL